MRTISRRQADVSSLIDRDRPIFIDDVSYQVGVRWCYRLPMMGCGVRHARAFDTNTLNRC
jgi:hypothetical protein